ncbi:MAG: hypothetical protein ABL857_06980, partial [Rickettsiales bacterium]
TELRNGVLIYLAVKDRQFAIIGDVGINEKVPEKAAKKKTSKKINKGDYFITVDYTMMRSIYPIVTQPYSKYYYSG